MKKSKTKAKVAAPIKTKFKPGDHVITNAAYARLFSGRTVDHEGTLLREGATAWTVRMHLPNIHMPWAMAPVFFEKFEEAKHVGKLTNETVKLSGFTWTRTTKYEWLAPAISGEIGVPRIKMLDDHTYCVYRNGKYLGAEPTLEVAAERVKKNVLKPQQTKAQSAPPAPAEEAKRARAKVHAEVAKTRKTSAPKDSKRGERDAAILAIMKRGCTRDEVLRVTGWQAVSMQQMAQTLGVGLRVDKSSKPFKYFSEEVK